VKFNDLRQLEDNLVIETDLCIVGSGPAGLSIAKEFANTNIRVWIIESSGLKEDPEAQTLYDIESVGVPRVMQQDILRYRIWGGSSHLWTGRCAPFDDIDFQTRPWIPHSGWPVSRTEMEPYFERAGQNLGIGPNCYDEQLWAKFGIRPPSRPLNSQLLKPTFWQFSRHSTNPGEPVRFGRDFMPSHAPNINVLLHANVTHINTNEVGKQVESIEVQTLDHKRACINAKAIVLCCGGIENARLLLASNRILPNGVGNQHDMVGRFLMDHAGCVLGTFDPRRSAKVQDRFGHYWLDDAQGRHVYLHGVSLSPELQAREQLLNCAAYLEVYASQDDPWHTVKRLSSSLKGVESSLSVYRDARLVSTNLLQIGNGLYRRKVKHRPPIEKADRIELWCLCEQQPNPDSRVMLSDKTDRLGMPLSKLNWQISEQEKRSVQRLGNLICQEFQRLGLPQPELADWLNSDDNGHAHFVERAHPTGTTRMSVNPKEGVVDPHGQVHDVAGLFIAGSSVFPTAGHANPTLMVVATALRLADRLKTHEFNTTAHSEPVASVV
jgi:choline dehydrogenase-like flavoprotein